jgi:hypothetical protein
MMKVHVLNVRQVDMVYVKVKIENLPVPMMRVVYVAQLASVQMF